MKISQLLLLSLLLLTMACARSNYQDGNNDNRNPANANQDSTCALQLTQTNLCVDLIWDHRPTETDYGSFTLEFYDPSDRTRFIDPSQTLEVQLWMPSMGHGSSPVKIDRVDVGQYRVSNVFFTMHGTWDIQIRLKNGNVVVDQVAQSYNF